MKDHNLAEGIEMPLGLSRALAQDVNAMDYFASLPDQKQQEIIGRTHSIQSKQEMHQLVRDMMNGLV